MPRRILIALSCGALGLGGALVAGCGGGSDNTDSKTTPVATVPVTATPAGQSANVVMQNNLFAPDKVSVKVGQKIHWVNNDPYPHTVTAKNGAFNSKIVNGKRTFDYTAKKAGRIPYRCTIHSGMTGAIVVTQ